MRIAALSLMMLVLCGGAASASEQCALRHLDTCANTNELIWSTGFEQAVRHFTGTHRANYLYSGNHLVSEQILVVLGGPPDDAKHAGPFWLFSACRPHSCEEKGAALLTPDGRIAALAILHSTCAEAHPAKDCFSHDILTIFTRRFGQSEVDISKGCDAAPGLTVCGVNLVLDSWADRALTGAFQDAKVDRGEIITVAP